MLIEYNSDQYKYQKSEISDASDKYSFSNTGRHMYTKHQSAPTLIICSNLGHNLGVYFKMNTNYLHLTESENRQYDYQFHL